MKSYFGFYALPAKEELSPMFPNESSSDEISKINAFTQNSKEDNVDVNDVPEQLAESQTIGFVFSNEVTSAATYLSAQLSFTFPTDQVPVSRDAIDRTNERGVPVNMAAVSLPSLYAQMKTKQQQQHALSWSSPHFPPAAMTILAGDCETGSLHPGADGSGIKQLNTGCGSCGCTHYHPNPSSKSEALCQVSLGKDGGKAGADPTSRLFSEAIFSASVISSSSCGTAEPPSLATSHGAEQGFNAMFASHHGSSSSNSLSICAQSHTTSFTTTTTTTMDVEPTHVSQANENPNNITTVSQHVINLSVETVRGLLWDNPPSLDDGQSEMKEEGEEDKFTTGALSDQDNNIINVKIFPKNIDSVEIVDIWQPKNQDANDDINKVWSVTPFLNIPKSQGEGTTLPASAKNATVQGKTDGHPPPSFNTSNNVKNCVEGNESISLLQIQGGTHLKDFYIDGPATNARWGIPPGLGLRGGGESSLNSGTSSWGTPSGGNSNNNNNPNSTAGGWGGNNQGQGSTAAQSQWGNNNNVNRNPSSGGSSQGPSGQQNPSNTNKGTNPQSSQPSSQQTQQSQAPSSQPQQQQQQQQQQQNGSTSWAQAAGKGLPASQQPNTSGTGNNSSNNNNNPGSGNSGSSGAGGSGTNSNTGNNSTKQQLEQLNTMREALFSQDGWGGQYVNQDTGWDIPASPEPGVKDGVPVWKPNVNNGTDLWEANLRNGGQPPPSQTQKTPWGHTPTTNIGGTWGEDDDVGDSSNVWTGVPSNTGPGGATGQWGANSAGASGGMWGAAAKKDNDWTGGGGGGGSSWGDPRDPRGDPRGMDPRDPRDPRNVGAMDPRDLRGDPRDTRSGMIDPRDHMRAVVDPMRGDVGMRDLRDIRGMGDIRGGDPMMRGDPRGISGRLNGGTTNDGMWGQPPQPPHHAPHHQQSQPPGKMVGPGGVTGGGVNQWVGPPPKDMNMPGTGSKPSGWEEPSPPAQRRNIPNYDDGTSLWGNPAQQQSRMGGKVSHWKEAPMSSIGRGGMQCPPGMSHNRMPGNGSGNMKPDGGPLWAHAPRNGSWGDGPHDTVNSGWVDESKSGVGAVNSWNEPPLTPTSWGPKPKNSLNPGWVDGEMEASWGHAQKQGPKPVTKDFIWSSKQFRILAEMGFKKEDVETALHSTNMNLEDAIELLNGRLVEPWRRHEDHSPFDLASSHPGAAFTGQRFNPVTQQMAFPPGPGVSNAPSLLNNMNNPNASLAASINNLSPAIVQKIIAQQPPPQQPPTQQQAPFNQAPRPPQNQPSTQQLRMLVQQIQMAVQAGYLNHQILNQPLAPQTLILLNQLLQQIKVLQQLMQQQAVVQVQPLKGGSSAVLHISVQITKTKQQIANLQNQIASQQAIYVKQQQQQQHHMTPQGPQSDFFKPHDPLTQLQTNFGELNIKEPPQPTYQGQQSRLNQWKLPSIGDKETDSVSNEFSRAPGTTTKPSLQQSHSSPNINPLGLGQSDGPWSTVNRSSSDGWPEPSGDGSGQPDNKDSWPVTSQPSSSAFTDLVPEFEPGKPWKGTQLKSIEDDPSITPGSVVRSPLSLVTIKDTEIFNAGGSKTSPTVSSTVDTTMPPLSLPTLSSSTWSFNPPVSSAPSFTSPLGKLGGSKGTWGEGPPPTVVTSELWGAPTGKSRGPPPGLSNKNTSGNAGSGSGVTVGNSSNGWGSLATGAGSTGGSGVGNNAAAVVASGGGGRSSSWGIQGTTAGSWGSTWLLLKNLTPQIDGSTLKTLCMQHGPLQSFHLYLNHSIALAKYSTREEANKAQGALNNCVLGNTTIFAEAPGDTDVHLILQHLGHGAQQAPPGGSSGGWNMRGGSTPVAPGASKGAPTSDTWAPGSSQLWNPTPSSGSLWGAAPLDTSGDQHRATPSSLNSFLPGDLLGGESM